MNATDYIVIAVIAVIIAAAVGYIVWAKRSGKKCIGCPDSSSCQSGGCCGSCASCQGCHTSAKSADDEATEGGCPHCQGKNSGEDK